METDVWHRRFAGGLVRASHPDASGEPPLAFCAEQNWRGRVRAEQLYRCNRVPSAARRDSIRSADSNGAALECAVEPGGPRLPPYRCRLYSSAAGHGNQHHHLLWAADIFISRHYFQRICNLRHSTGRRNQCAGHDHRPGAGGPRGTQASALRRRQRHDRFAVDARLFVS